MATDTFNNGTENDYAADASWTAGVAPAPGDTAVISSTGGPTAAIANATSIYEDETGDSIADVTASVVAIPLPIVVFNDSSNPPLEFIYYPDVTQAQAQAPGETIAGQTVDLIGGGSVAALFLQNSTLAADTTVNVSGVAAFGSQFTNTLDGTIRIGLPFSVGGVPITAPPADSIGTVNELDINVRATGSWTLNADGSYSLSGTVPGVVNNGQIVVGADSALRVQLHGGAGGPFYNGFNDIYAINPSASQFTNNGIIAVDAGGTAAIYETASPPGLAAPYESVVNDGSILVTGAAGQTTAFLDQATFTGGLVEVQGGGSATVAEFAGDVAGTTFDIAGAVLQLDVATNLATTIGIANQNQFSGGEIDFTGAGGVLSIGTNSGGPIYPTELDTIVGNIATPINGFAAGDAIDLTFAFGASSSILAEGTFSFQTIWTQSTHQLQIEETVVPPSFFSDRTPQTAIIASLTLNGVYDPSGFSVSYPDSYSEYENITLVVTTTSTGGGAPCFVAGTLIATPDGERPVETLRPGDLVLPHGGGEPLAVVWVGHRRVDCAADPSQAPVRVRAGALGRHTPRRDLLVSPDHALFLDGVLVPAERLADGRTIHRDAADRVVYHHVELATHAILLAEGAPAESYLDTGNRDRFGNCPLGYDPVSAAANDPCAEMLFGGPRLAAIRARLSVMAAV